MKIKIYTPAGELPFECFNFPDGQPHVKLGAHLVDYHAVTIETAIQTPGDLFVVGLAVEVLRAHGARSIDLNIRYLMGARMDRAISTSEPFTLRHVAENLNAMGFRRVRILDAHSPVSLRLINHAENVLPTAVVRALMTIRDFKIVAPDAGAVDRVQSLCGRIDVRATKHRDMATGKLSDFALDGVLDLARNQHLLVVDDICDGGSTFVGLAHELTRALNPLTMALFVTHGIFSKGIKPLTDAGFDCIYCTDSLHTDLIRSPEPLLVRWPVSMSQFG